MSGLSIDFRIDARDVEVALDVPEGRRLAVIGPNAAGKSTVLQVTAGLLVPDRGQVGLDGRVLTDTERGVLVPPHKRQIGLMAQSGLLFKHLSVLDNVAFGPRSRRATRKTAHRTAHEWLERLGVDDLASRRSGELSGGQAQRVALARTLAAAPDALLLDEPTSALDVRVAAGLRALLAEVTRDRTTVLVSHDLLDIVSLADHLVVIEHGRVVERGPTAEVLARPGSAFAARLADVNIIRGRLQDASTMVAGPLLVFGIGESEGQAGGAGVATVRPGSITVALIPPVTSARNVWQGTVTTLVAMPHAIRIRVDLGEVEVAADVTAESAARMRLAPGVGVWLSAKAQEVVITSDPGDTQSTV